ncbi:lysophospholipid acyltransferase family protein [Scleromatobacter humisilvae]|uniref:1-acyl-sn-glycerol-3-phosphate acyltransferase n=1 Tax=Scleromatobacter humisilvae TaxID=2897159 RepID=A0A9X2BYL1_9BURK|nr:lysophospholipid acyltransferase family protein [Scleromatobacter humisilvae]MCK9684301.1 1-acyl-sn-glycerol-3-phosphate acyltransferase [Scleromatobacter humisilvae]
MSEAAVIGQIERSSLLNRWWRVAATGFSFALFGVGGLLLGVVVAPLMLVVVRHRRRRSALMRGVIHHLFRAFVAMMCGFRLCSVEVRGRERLRRHGLLILASHPSLIDVVFLMALVRDADCIVKAALLRNPFTLGPVRAAGFVCNDSGPGMIDDCVASVRAGNNLIVFPEGTRTPAGSPLGRLQRGAANLAVRGALSITPVRITCSQPMLAKTDKWWRVPPRAGHFTIDVGEDIPIDSHLAEDGAQALAARRLTDELARLLGAERPHAAA